MADQDVQNVAAANALAAKRMSPRARHMAMLERWVEGTQYEGLADWFADVPIGEKAPCVVEPIVADSIDSHVDMVLGEQRFPALTTRPGEEEDEGDEDGGLNEDDSATIDRLICGIVDQSRFRAICREALTMAMSSGSVGVIYGARAGKLCGDTVKGRWCTPELGPDSRTVLRLVIEYPYVECYRDEQGVWKMRACIFRREIDDQKDVTFKPSPAEIAVPDWKVDRQDVHGLGFCPVVWYPFFRGCSIVGQVDGKAPHANLLDEIRAHDVALSQRHRAALYAGDPQWTECGVEPGANPSASGKVRPVPITRDGGAPSADNPVIGSFPEAPSDQGTGRKKHPGTVWQYEDKDTKVTLHQLSGDALKAISDNGSDIRLKIMQALAYVPLDPESAQIIRGSLSGKALDSLRERQLNRDDRIRDDFGDGFIKPSMSMLMRICHVKGSGLTVRGLKKAAPILARFATDAVG